MREPLQSTNHGMFLSKLCAQQISEIRDHLICNIICVFSRCSGLQIKLVSKSAIDHNNNSIHNFRRGSLSLLNACTFS